MVALDLHILVMDEPFGALDELTRIEMQIELLLRGWAARRKTALFVTRSSWEALAPADRVIVLASWQVAALHRPCLPHGGHRAVAHRRAGEQYQKFSENACSILQEVPCIA